MANGRRNRISPSDQAPRRAGLNYPIQPPVDTELIQSSSEVRGLMPYKWRYEAQVCARFGGTVARLSQLLHLISPVIERVNLISPSDPGPRIAGCTSSALHVEVSSALHGGGTRGGDEFCLTRFRTRSVLQAEVCRAGLRGIRWCSCASF